MRVALVRHPPAAVAPGICYGRTDVSLAPGAAAAIVAICAALADFAAPIVTSPARRCAEVAATLGAARADARLLELDFGTWEGIAWDDVPRAALDQWAADPLGFASPGGESGAALVARVSAFHAELRGDCIVVSHGGPLRVLAALLRGRPVDLLAKPPPLGSVTLIGRAG